MEKASQRRGRNWFLAGLLAWLLPGAGHWYLNRPIRAAVIFFAIHIMFWSGIAIGGVFTVNPRQEIWWCRAQMLTGINGLASYERQDREYTRTLHDIIQQNRRGSNGNYSGLVDERLAQNNLVLPAANGVAYVLTGVAGMLNLMCIFDALILGLMRVSGEPTAPESSSQVEGPAAPRDAT
jgi:hypothetical protein